MTPANTPGSTDQTQKISGYTVTGTLFPKLLDWYASHCDGVWEHTHGLSLSTLDNPGWCLTLFVNHGGNASILEVDRSEGDWVRVKASASSFMARGGPNNLNELVTLALVWLEPYSAPAVP